MNQFNNAVGNSAQVDLGLKNFMLGTYRYMAMAMAVTAVVAYMTSQYMLANQSLIGLVTHPFMYIISLGIIIFGFGAVGKNLHRMSLGGVLSFTFGFAAFMGVLMSTIALRYDEMIIAKIFFMTVAMFGSLSIFGYSTERNLSVYMKYAVAVIIGFVALSLIGFIVPSLSPYSGGVFGTVMLVGALIAFALVTAWETQMLKRVYYGNAGNPAMEGKLAAFGAASLLLAFINMFQLLLALFGRE